MSGSESSSADVYVGRVFTGTESGWAEAVAVAGGVVRAVGSREQVLAEAPDSSQVREADVVLPGFVDSHIHALWLGRAQFRLDLDRAPSVAAMCQAIRERAETAPPGGWILGSAGVAESDLAERRLPSLAELDAAAAGRPLYLDRRGHDALANSAALELAGIGSDTPNPPGGHIDRGPDGKATGLLCERPAAALVEGVIPSPSLDEVCAWISAAHKRLLAVGVTTVADPALSIDEIAAYAEAARRGVLRVRTVVFPLGGDHIDPDALWQQALETGAAEAAPEQLGLGPVKLFLDGAGGLGTALRRDPWPDTGSPGMQVTSSRTLHDYADWAWKRGKGLAVHTVGPRAVELALDAFESASSGAPWPRGRMHLIHAYLEQERSSMQRAARLGIGVSVHPALHHNARSGLQARFGPQADEKIVRVADWLASGALVGGGSDGPGCELDPLVAIRELVPSTGLDAALRFYTGDAAAVIGRDAGKLSPGVRADLLLGSFGPDGQIARVEAVLGGTAVR